VPKYGNDAQNGFFLRDGGYYWAASENFGLKILGTVYTNGSFEPIHLYSISGTTSLAAVSQSAIHAPPQPDPILPQPQSYK
jgi:hypothetical protein